MVRTLLSPCAKERLATPPRVSRGLIFVGAAVCLPMLAACGAEPSRLSPIDDDVSLHVAEVEEAEPPTSDQEYRGADSASGLDDDGTFKLPDTDSRFIAPYAAVFEPARAYLFATERAPTPLTVWIKNTGTKPFVVRNTFIEADQRELSARFSLLDAVQDQALAPGDRLSVRISYSGGSYETTGASLVFATDIPGNSQKRVSILAKIFRAPD